MAAQSRAQNYILKIDLHPQYITNPRITRTLSCPATATFADLHQALLVAFGWSNAHAWNFEILGHNDKIGRNNTFQGSPSFFLISDTDSLEYNPGGARYRSKVSLFEVLERDPQTAGKTIIYNYNLEDRWEHVISCIGRTDATLQFICLEGEGHGAAEDVGGYIGWQELLEAYNTRNPTRDQKERIRWYETYASNKDSDGLRGERRWRWDKNKINGNLEELGGNSKNPPGLSGPLPSILIVSLDKTSIFDETYTKVLDKLRSKASVTEASHVAGVLQHLRKPNLKQMLAAIVVTDPAVMEDEFETVQEKLVDYVQNGGTVILGFLHGNLGEPDDLNQALKTIWGLNWKIGDYKSVACSRNAQVSSSRIVSVSNLPDEYRMKALHLKDTRVEDRIYVQKSGNDQSPAVLASIGKGYLGWIGGVNIEPVTIELLFAMFGA